MVQLTMSLTAEPEPTEDLDQLLLRGYCTNGDREALRQLFHRHAEAGYRAALRLLRNETDAEDAVQEGFLHAMTRAKQYRGEGSVRSWLLALIANASRQRMRENVRRRRREHTAASLPPIEPDRTDQAVSMAVRACLDELPEKYRTPVAMRYLDEFSFADIASVLGAKEKTARSLVSRGLEQLRIMLGKRGVAISALLVGSSLSGLQVSTIPQAVAEKLDTLCAKCAALPVSLHTTAALNIFIAKMTIAVAGIALTIGGLNLTGVFSSRARVAATPMTAPAMRIAGDVQFVQNFLGRPIYADYRYDSIKSVLQAIHWSCPPGQRVPVACEVDSRTSATIAIHVAPGTYRIRDLFDQVAQQCNLSWRNTSVGVIFERPLDDHERQRLIDAFSNAATDLEMKDAAKQLASTQNIQAVRALILALSESGAKANAACAALTYVAGGFDNISSRDSSEDPLGSFFMAYADDDACCRSALAALDRNDIHADRWPVILLAGALKIAESQDRLLVMLHSAHIRAQAGEKIGLTETYPIAALGDLGVSSAAAPITEFLQDLPAYEARQVRGFVALRALSRLHAPVPHVAEALWKNMLANPGEVDLDQLMFIALTGDSDMVSRLIAFICDTIRSDAQVDPRNKTRRGGDWNPVAWLLRIISVLPHDQVVERYMHIAAERELPIAARRGAIEQLAHCADGRCIPLLKEISSDWSNTGAKELAIDACGARAELGDVAAISELASRMTWDSSWSLSIARTLARVHRDEAAEALCAAPPRSEDVMYWQYYAEALAECSSSQAAELIMHGSFAPRFRLSILSHVSLCRHPAVRAYLCERLAADPDNDVRLAVCRSMHGAWRREEIELLVKMSIEGEDTIRVAATEALAQVSDWATSVSEELDFCERAINDRSPDVRVLTLGILIRALIHIRGVEADLSILNRMIAVTSQALNDQEEAIRIPAVRFSHSLTDMIGDPASTRAKASNVADMHETLLRLACADASAEVRSAAATRLLDSGWCTQEARAAIEQHLLIEESPDVRNAIRSGLGSAKQ
jgi:RNA polymerase sigma factor (sigma-70 family)